MGRLPFVIALEVLGLAGCDDRSSRATRGRSDQVIATGDAAMGAAPSWLGTAPSHATDVVGRSGKLCEGNGNAKGRVLPKTSASHVEASGAVPIEGMLPRPTGHWTWVNFWAAWCGPCREEIPRLMDWRSRLAQAGTPLHLVFVSLDDDKRQLDLFLDAQPKDGMRASLWLPEGALRATWLKGLRMNETPDLPEHALIDSTGRVRCFIEGAIDDADYPEIAALVAR